MKKTSILFVFYCLFFVQLSAQQKISKSDSLAIVSKLFKQQADWNKGDIDAFMEGYLKSDKLVFSGSSRAYLWLGSNQRAV